MQAENSADFKDIASHMTPGHALSSDTPYFFNNDAINMAALDNLIHFTEKVLVLKNELFVHHQHCCCCCCCCCCEQEEDLLFMDLAGAPSSFSHYVYWKKQNLVKVSRHLSHTHTHTPWSIVCTNLLRTHGPLCVWQGWGVV